MVKINNGSGFLYPLLPAIKYSASRSLYTHNKTCTGNSHAERTQREKTQEGTHGVMMYRNIQRDIQKDYSEREHTRDSRRNMEEGHTEGKPYERREGHKEREYPGVIYGRGTYREGTSKEDIWGRDIQKKNIRRKDIRERT